jgi:hypothetical protein
MLLCLRFLFELGSKNYRAARFHCRSEKAKEPLTGLSRLFFETLGGAGIGQEDDPGGQWKALFNKGSTVLFSVA